jgi:hypothetical protein
VQILGAFLATMHTDEVNQTTHICVIAANYGARRRRAFQARQEGGPRAWRRAAVASAPCKRKHAGSGALVD